MVKLDGPESPEMDSWVTHKPSDLHCWCNSRTPVKDLTILNRPEFVGG